MPVLEWSKEKLSLSGKKSKMKKDIRVLSSLLVFLLVFTFACASKTGSSKMPATTSVHDVFITKITPKSTIAGMDLYIEASDTVQYTVFRLENPKRLVLDMPNIDSTAFSAPIELGEGLASKISTKYFSDTGNSRVEILLNEPVLYKVTRIQDNKVHLSLSPLEKKSLNDRKIQPDEIEILGVELREMSGLGRILIRYKGEKPKFEMIRKREKKRIVLNIYNAKILRANEKLFSVTAKDSIINKVAAFQFSTKPEGVVKILANLNEYTSSNVFERDGVIMLDIGSQAILADASSLKKEEKSKDLTGKKKKTAEEYAGQKVSLDFQNADVRNVLRIIADVSKLNFIISDKVSGKVSMKLIDVPWDLALDTILTSSSLGMKRNGNIIRVATINEISSENRKMVNASKDVSAVEPLFLKVFQINYESVDKLKANLSSIKSSRGSIDINERSNTLIIQETKDKLSEMERLIEILDRRTVQVLLEARIVEVSHSFTRELGIRWGGRYSANTGAAFPNTVGLSGINSAGTASSVAGDLVNLGTAGAPTGAIGVTLGHVNGTALLDMQLLALQNQGKGRILSMPKIATMNNTEALIESGREIPYQTISANGTETAFKRATLSLRVTPHVAKDEIIRLEIEVNKDEADFSNQLPGAPPPLLTKRAKTEVLVKDGDTTVLGGLFKEVKTNNSSSVPGLSKLPLVGWMFKNKANTETGEELLIFITPKTF